MGLIHTVGTCLWANSVAEKFQSQNSLLGIKLVSGYRFIIVKPLSSPNKEINQRTAKKELWRIRNVVYKYQEARTSSPVIYPRFYGFRLCYNFPGVFWGVNRQTKSNWIEMDVIVWFRWNERNAQWGWLSAEGGISCVMDLGFLNCPSSASANRVALLLNKPNHNSLFFCHIAGLFMLMQPKIRW